MFLIRNCFHQFNNVFLLSTTHCSPPLSPSSVSQRVHASNRREFSVFVTSSLRFFSDCLGSPINWCHHVKYVKWCIWTCHHDLKDHLYIFTLIAHARTAMIITFIWKRILKYQLPLFLSLSLSLSLLFFFFLCVLTIRCARYPNDT